METLTARDKSICLYAGGIGIMLSITCLIQHFIITRPHWISALMSLAYIASVVAFSLLAAQRYYAYPVLIAATIALFLVEIFLFSIVVIPLAVFLLLIYCFVFVMVLRNYDIPQKLKQRMLWVKKEKEAWEGLI